MQDVDRPTRPGCLAWAARSLALLLSALFMMVLPPALAARSAGQVLFSPRLVSQVVTGRVVEQGLLRAALRESLMASARPSEGQAQPEGQDDFDLRRALEHLDPAELEAFIDLLLPPGWAGEQVTRNVEALYAWLDSDLAAPALSLDLAPLRERLMGGGAADLVELVLDSWPACGLEQIEQMTTAAAALGEVPVLYCEPPEPFRSQLSAFTLEALEEQVRALPAQAPLGEQAEPGAVEAAAQAKAQLRTLRALSQWGWLLALGLLGLIMALVVRSLGALGRWWGIPLLIAGVLTLGLSLVGGMLLRGWLLPQLAAAAGALPRAAQLIQLALAEGLGGQIVRRQALLAMLPLLSGGVLLVIAALARPRRAPPAPPPEAETLRLPEGN